MNKIYIVPREGLKVPDPEMKDHLPPEGREVRDSPYWRRRLRDKEVIIGDLEAIEAAAEAKIILAAIEADKARKAEETPAPAEPPAAEESPAPADSPTDEEAEAKSKRSTRKKSEVI